MRTAEIPDGEILKEVVPFNLPLTLLLGVVTASLQIEGGDRNNNWYRWAEEGHIKDGSSPLRACDHWNRVDEDIHIMQELNINCYRMSLEWSRIEPQPGCFDKKALDHYRQELGLLNERGIRPMVSLHHFSNPLWFEDGGAWSSGDSADVFYRFVRYAVEGLGDLCKEWISINEPNVYITQSYLFGEWPPGLNKPGIYFRTARNMIKAHLRVYDLIHEIHSSKNLSEPMVGVAHHLRIFDPLRDKRADRFISRIYTYLFEDLFLRSMTEGKLLFPLGWGAKRDGAFNRIGKLFSDFIGINYYTREMLRFRFHPRSFFSERQYNKKNMTNDLGWEIYPEGLYRVCKKAFELYGLPIFITENGICDVKDTMRPAFILMHLAQIKRLLDEGITINRYYHWSLMDNFEWAEGESARFGLYETDYATEERKPRKSAELYSEICSTRHVSEHMIEEHSP